MVALLSKSTIQSFNIDTVEKALVFGALVVRANIVGKDNANTENFSISISVSTIGKDQTFLSLEAYLPYDAYEFNTNGGLLLDSMEEISTAPILEGDLELNSFPSNSGLVIPDYDESQIDTFEKYLIYYAQILWASVEDSSSSTISLSFLENQEDAQILISANLPFEIKQWLLGHNYLNAVRVAVPSYNSPSSGGDLPPDLGTGNYYVSYGDPGVYAINELLVVERPGVLEIITIDVDPDSPANVLETYFYLNGVNLFEEEVFDNEDGSYDFIFDAGNNPIFLEPGDVLAFEMFEEPTPEYMDFNIYIFESPIQGLG